MKKNYIILILVFLLLTLIFYKNYYFIKRQLAQRLPSNISTFLRIATNVDGNLFAHYNNDYKVKFLPRTQFLTLDFKKIKLNFLKKIILELTLMQWIFLTIT